jgi:hypothetical protein
MPVSSEALQRKDRMMFYELFTMYAKNSLGNDGKGGDERQDRKKGDAKIRAVS